MPSPEKPRTLPEKTLDVGLSVLSIYTFPRWFVAGVNSAATGAYLGAGIFAVLAISDVVTVAETFKEKKSKLNPAYWIDWFRGRNRLGGNQRLAHSSKVTSSSDTLAA